MDGLIQAGIEWIVAIQSLGGWLEAPMKFFSFLGSQDFFFLVLPLLYWSVDSALGVRVAMILFASVAGYINGKYLLAAPRPYWISDRVVAFAADPLFGIPSGHSQSAIAIWGTLAARIRRPWAWAVALLLAFLIGFSRLYLGVHFVHDVLAGWLIGLALLWTFHRFWDSTAAWLKSRSFRQQAVLAFFISLLLIAIGLAGTWRLSDFVLPAEWAENALRAGELPDPLAIEDHFTMAGTFFGTALGLAWITSRGGYQASGPAMQRALRFFVGLIGVLLLWRGLGLILSEGETLVPLVFRYFRYMLVGLWIFAGAPWLFFRIKLAEPPKM